MADKGLLLDLERRRQFQQGLAQSAQGIVPDQVQGQNTAPLSFGDNFALPDTPYQAGQDVVSGFKKSAGLLNPIPELIDLTQSVGRALDPNVGEFIRGVTGSPSRSEQSSSRPAPGTPEDEVLLRRQMMRQAAEGAAPPYSRTSDLNALAQIQPEADYQIHPSRLEGFTGALTDAEARQNIMRQMGLKDESELQYDAYGNIANRANALNALVQQKQQENQAAEQNQQRQALNTILMQEVLKNPQMALQVLAQQAAQRSAQQEGALSLREQERKELDTLMSSREKKGRFALDKERLNLDRSKAEAEADPFNVKNMRAATKDTVSALMENLNLSGQAITPKALDTINDLVNMSYAVQHGGLYDPDANRIWKPEQIQKAAARYGMTSEEYYQAKFDEYMQRFAAANPAPNG